MRKAQFITKLLLLLLDFTVCFLSFLLSYNLRKANSNLFSIQLFQGYIPNLNTYIPFVFYVSILLVLVFYIGGVYKVNNYSKEKNITILVFIWILLISSYFFWVRVLFFSRFVLIVGSLITYFSILITRVITKKIIKTKYLNKYFQKEIVLIGLNNLNKIIFKDLNKNSEYLILKNFNINKEKNLSTIKSFIKNNNVQEIIQTDVGDDKEFDLKLLDFCQVESVTYKFIPNLFDIHKKNITTGILSKYPILELNPTPLDGWKRVIKRIFDVCFATIVLFCLIPIIFIISIIIKTTSKGPVFVVLKRVRYKEVFGLFKFRSMIVGAHKQKKELSDNNERKDGPLFKIKNDPRITKVGKFIRKTRIDELPQFYNVLKGDMSIVGPRPHEPEEVAQYKKHHRKLLSIKPGLTGMAQVNGASDLSFEEEVRLDTFYIENWSLFLDIKIIFQTVWVVITCKGAH